MRVFYVTCATSWRNPGDKAKGWPDGAHVAGFYDAWHEGVANTIVHFARTLKAISPDRLVGAFYGALGETDYYALGTATGTAKTTAEPICRSRGCSATRWPSTRRRSPSRRSVVSASAGGF